MENKVQIVKTNIIASLNIFNYKEVHIVAMHLSNVSPKLFEDSFGNLWYKTELSNFNHIK